jgi:tetratricopeptide (TPR) repeat protein
MPAGRNRKSAPPAPRPATGLANIAASGLAGASGSAAALARLDKAALEIKALRTRPAVQAAIAALKAEDPATASRFALQALETDEKNGLAWYLLAIAHEKTGAFAQSVQAYEKALGLLPNAAEVANDLGRLAYRMGMKAVAEKLFRRYLDHKPRSYEAANNLACAVRDLGRYEEAIDILRPAIMANPTAPMLWNTMGTILSEQGDPAGAVTFFDEALRLEVGFAKARYNRGNARLALGALDQALDDCQQAMSGTGLPASDFQMMRLARSTIQIARGAIGEGWDDYEARLHPDFADHVRFMVPRPRWTPETDLAGKTLLLMGEQGLGDEVLFANLIPDLLKALGPDGKLVIAVEERLVPLFARAFPTARVGAHTTFFGDGRLTRGAAFIEDIAAIDLWTPMASLLRRFRRSVAAYPSTPGFLPADPSRVAYWREALKAAPAGLKVGILWKSLKLTGARARYFSPFDAWAPVLTTPGVSFINLQYGDCSEELTLAREAGIPLWTPPGIDLKNDLDDVTALSCALDLTIGFANATTNLAAAAGAPVWLVSTPGAWPRLGTSRYPWYPQARVFLPPQFREWDPVMKEVAAALRERTGAQGDQGTEATPKG